MPEVHAFAQNIFGFELRTVLFISGFTYLIFWQKLFYKKKGIVPKKRKKYINLLMKIQIKNINTLNFG